MISKHAIPNALSWLRLVMIAPILLVWAFAPPLMHYPVLLACFVIAAITDFLDGYLARRWGVHSTFGAMLDQITDKLVVACVLVLLVDDGVIAPYAPILILLREIYVSGLREARALERVAMPVSKLGKTKTATQMIAITALLASRGLSPMMALPDVVMFGLYATGAALLWVSALLGLISALQYSRRVR